MLLTIAIIVVVVLLAVALLPMKKREPEQLRQASRVAFLTPDPPWRYSDPFRLKLRIHTKQIESHPS